MPTYEEYKKKVYEIFLNEYLKNVSRDDKIKHLEENEDVIQNAYKGDVYDYEEGIKNTFTDWNISSTICNTLDMLY